MMRVHVGAVWLAVIAAAAPVAGQTPDRSDRPAVGPPPAVTLPVLQQFRLENGMSVLLMEKHDVPLVQLNLVIGAGSARDEAGRHGVASMTADMLDEGAGGRTALEIADGFEMLGARFGVAAGTHATVLSLRTSAARMDDALQLAAAVLLRPDFPTAELERLRAERITSLIRRHDDPNAIAAVLTAHTLFGASHAYARSSLGDEATLAAMRVADLQAFHSRYYRPDNTTAILAGAIDASTARRLLEEVFGVWERGDVIADPPPTAQQVQGRTIYLVDKPGAAQSVIRIGRIGVPRSTPDYFALEVMNVILGGSFTSRLNQNLREDKGYTYGASSGFEYMPGPGPWIAGAAVQPQSTGAALAEFMKELAGMHAPIPGAEVERAKSFLAMRYPAGFQSVAGIASRLVDVVQYDLPADYFNTYVDRVLSVTADDVSRVAHRYIDPANIAIVVVGDRSVIEEQVRQQGLGDVRLLEVADVLGPMPAGGR